MRLIRLLFAVGLVASAPFLQAQSTRVAVPDTPAGRLLGMWIQAFNSRDSAKMGAFVRQYMPELQTRAPAAFARLWQIHGGALEVASIAQNQPQHIDAILKETNAPPNPPPNLHATFDVPDVAHPTMANFFLGVPPASCASYTETPGTAASGANPKDVASMDAIVAAIYDAISGAACQHRDWDRFRSLFAPGARLIPTAIGPDGKLIARVETPDEYVASVRNSMENNGFFEHEISRTVETFGSISQVFSTYESRRRADDEKPFARGINSIQLLNDGTRWWVVTVYWQGERPDRPIPAAYLKKP
jgi:hypothetical protein